MLFNISIDKQKSAYELMFLIENILRVSMHNIMVKNKGVNYFNETNFPPFKNKHIACDKEINIIQLTKERKSTEKKYNLFIGYDYNYFWYLDFNILITVLENFWELYFKEILQRPKKDKQDLFLRLNNISPIRNALAHNRYISNIDLADLESLFKILNVSINKDFLLNIEQLVTNPFEKQVDEVLNICKEIQKYISKKEVVPHRIINNFKSVFSVLISIQEEKKIEIREFEEIIKLTNNYNENLPRKPGSGEIIDKFLKSSSLNSKISDFIINIRSLV